MFEFTDDYLSLLPGTIRYWSAEPDPVKTGSWSIDIPLAPFSARDSADPQSFGLGVAGPQIIETSIRLDFIFLPVARLKDLGNATISFPVNPAEGYVDGTIYLGGAHNPVDVTQIRFGNVEANRVCAELDVTFDFTQERIQITNRNAVLQVELREINDQKG